MKKAEELHAVIAKINQFLINKFPDSILLDYGLPRTNPRNKKVFLLTFLSVIKQHTKYFEKYTYVLFNTETGKHVTIKRLIGKQPEVAMIPGKVWIKFKDKTFSFTVTDYDLF